VLPYETAQKRAINPWLFVPVLYIMQAMPVTTVQEMFTFVWKDLGVASPLIVAWISVMKLPWTLKLFWSPLVDLNSTKRRWVVAMQVGLALCFVLLLWATGLPQFAGESPKIGFHITLALLLLMGCMSSTHDIACDGLYLLSLDKHRQAQWVGVQSTCYKLGRLLCVGALVYLAGYFEKHGRSNTTSWMIAVGVAAALYIAGTIYNAFFLPRPELDKPAVESSPGENRRDIFRTVTVVAIGVCLYFLIASSLGIAGDWIYRAINEGRALQDAILAAWSQGTKPVRVHFVFFNIGEHLPVFQLYVTWLVSLIVMLPLIALARRQLSGTAMAEAFGSFVRQRGFWGILAFVLFYRFGEAMVTGALPLFLKDTTKGGLGIATDHAGLIVGGAGVFGIIFGGILGGVVVSRMGLRRSFWPLALCMHIPNLFYLLLAMRYRPAANPESWQNFVLTDWPLYIAAFVHEFGYGFGFAGYFVFLMDVAQRGKFRTAHYAFGTGLGALCGVLAGIVSAILLASVSYVGFFIAVCVLTIPGMLTLLVIPLDSNEGRGRGSVAAKH